MTRTIGTPARRSLRAARPHGWVATLALLFLLTSAQGTADAAFPGKNGRIAYAVHHYTYYGSDDIRTLNMWIRTVRPDGTGARRIGTGFGFETAPAFSPGGRRLAFEWFTYDGEGGLLTVGARGRHESWVTRKAGDATPDWSPTGRRLVFVRSGLWIHSAHGNRRLLKDGSEPAWSAMGDIAFTEVAAVEEFREDIYVVRPDGSGLRLIHERGSNPDWSPDGRKIVFETGSVDTGSDIAVVRADGSGFRRLTRGGDTDLDPAFSPDGRRIVFVRNTSSVVTMSASGRRVKRVATHHARSSSGVMDLSGPDWQPLHP